MKRIYYIGWLFCIAGTLMGGILNESFEIPDPNVTEWFIGPLYWTRAKDNIYHDCYAGLHSQFLPSPQYDRNENMVHWNIPAPFDGSKFVVLSTGDLGFESDQNITHGTITQRVTFQAGQRISGAYFFGTCDFLQYNDYGKIFLIPEDPNMGLPSEITLAYCDVQTVGDYQSTIEWKPFFYDFTEQTAGTYDLICTVEDVEDTIYKSYLAIDGLQVCSPLYDYGDLNKDCYVDLQDLSIMSRAWLSFCPDPNAIDNDPNTIPVRPGPPLPPGFFDPNDMPDPNCPCELADINKDWWVDPNDAIRMADHWLENGY